MLINTSKKCDLALHALQTETRYYNEASPRKQYHEIRDIAFELRREIRELDKKLVAAQDELAQLRAECETSADQAPL